MVRQRAHRNKGLRGPSNGSTRDKTKIDFSSRKFGLYQHALTAPEHASILSPSIRSPHGITDGYASMETYLLFALYLLRIIGSLGQLWNALALAPRAMNEVLNWRLSFRASIETYLLFALYLLRNIGSLGQLWNTPALAPRAMNEPLNWELSSRFFLFFFRLYTKLKHDHNRTTIHDFNLHQ